MVLRTAAHTALQTFRTGDAAVGVDLNDEPVGSAAMTCVCIISTFSKIAVNVGAQQNAVSHSNGSQNGWRMFMPSPTNFQSQVFDGTTASVLATSAFVMAGQETIVWAFSYTSPTVTSRVNGIVGTAAGAGGYTPPIAGREIQIGNRTGSNDRPALNFGIHAFLGSSTVDLDAAGLALLEAGLQADMIAGRDLRASLPAALAAAADLVYYDAEDLGKPFPAWSCREGNGVDLTVDPELTLGSYPVRF